MFEAVGQHGVTLEPSQEFYLERSLLELYLAALQMKRRRRQLTGYRSHLTRWKRFYSIRSYQLQVCLHIIYISYDSVTTKRH